MMTLRLNRGFPTSALLGNTVDEALNQLWGGPVAARPVAFPPVNAWEDESSLIVEAELPGLRLADLEISLTGDELTIAGKRVTPEVANATYHRRERPPITFTRTIRLGLPIVPDQVGAKLENGILTVTLPKAEAAKARKIAVVSK